MQILTTDFPGYFQDIVERGRSVNKVLDRYEKTVKPMHLQFIEPTKRYADIIIPQEATIL